MAITQFAGPIGLVITSALLTSMSIYQLAVVLIVIYLVIAIWAILRGMQILPTYVKSTATTATVGEVSPES